MKRFKYFLSFTVIIFLISCAVTQDVQKINGVSFVASRVAIDSTHVKPVVKLHANYAAIMPFGFTSSIDNPNIGYSKSWQWFGETKEGAKHYIKVLNKSGIKVMLKPQIWVNDGVFTGKIKMTNEADWEILEETYSNFILDFAQVAEDAKADIFCIGTELESFVTNRPDYWKHLISEVRKIYKGQLTYAANWNEFERTPFWNLLDYIGIDAYFPVSNEKTPTVEECLKGWEKHKATIKSFNETYDKPVLFTEFGYRSVDYSGKAPWTIDRTENDVNMEAQVNTTKALFETFWKEEWFAGGFVWKWFHFHDKAGGKNNNRFTPQNKPAESVISSYYQSN